MYFAKSYRFLPSQVNFCKVLSLHRDRRGFIAESSRRHCWWTIHCIYTESCVVNETFIRDSINWRNSIFGHDASQLYPFSMCQAMSTGLYTRWELDSESGKFKLLQNKTRKFENMVMSDHRVKWKVSTRQVHRKKTDAYRLDSFC